MATTVSGYTSDELDTLITAIKAAITAALAGRAYTFNGRSVSRQDLAELRKQMAWAVAEKNRIDRGGIRVRRGIPKV